MCHQKDIPSASSLPSSTPTFSPVGHLQLDTPGLARPKHLSPPSMSPALGDAARQFRNLKIVLPSALLLRGPVHSTSQIAQIRFFILMPHMCTCRLCDVSRGLCQQPPGWPPCLHLPPFRFKLHNSALGSVSVPPNAGACVGSPVTQDGV